MIKKLKYKEIDFKKYSDCIENAVQRKYSATKIYLDITTEKKWEVLVYNDYEAVMPIPVIKKFGLKLVINPRFCQQLGVFSKIDDKEINDSFLSYFEKKYKILYYAFNDANVFSTKLAERKNFLIYPNTYANIYQQYSPKRKRKLRLDKEIIDNSEFKEVNFAQVSIFIEKYLLGAKSEKDKQGFFRILEDFEKENCLKIFAFFLHGEIINTIITYSDDKTIALLGTFNNKDFVKISGASVLIDYAISTNIQDKIFDFEGSEIPAVEEFFRGFRPELRLYKVIHNSKINLLKKIIKPQR